VLDVKELSNSAVALGTQQNLVPADAAMTLYRMNATLPGVNGPLFYDVPENSRATEALGVGSMLFKVACIPADHISFDVDGNGTLIASGHLGTPSGQTAISGSVPLSSNDALAYLTIFGNLFLYGKRWRVD
jgi:hypothetical protein